VTLARFGGRNHPQQMSLRGAVHRVDERATPPELFAALDARFHFTIDVAASLHNAKCRRYYALEDDGLSKPWDGERVWCNPPYSSIEPWVAKAHVTSTALVVMLVPANRTEQGWWQEHVEPFRDRCGSRLRAEFLRGRVRFVHPEAEEIGPNERPPFGSVLLIWEPRP
jgi:phage N-6-adenine-methyltransferase